ncbi:hypothetical protein LTS14_005084 [Recurvomyces mirabilis]|uniref:uncharacterized protein n=1 Tax=Recurvomyces mirabilis TaxID=574656 RepID=UPI002DDE4692|nr:hypothetical protein LTS14_005084 [Recurvomyces mirabilis]
MSTSTTPSPANDGTHEPKTRTTPKKGQDKKPSNDKNNFGFIGPSPKRRPQRMRWTEENDIKLLLFGFDRDEIKGSEYQGIADSFVEKPTRKSVVERVTKLRTERNGLLRELGVWDVDEEGGGGGARDEGREEGDDEEVDGDGGNIDEDAEGPGRR